MVYEYFSASGLITSSEYSLTSTVAGPTYNQNVNMSGVYQVFINTSGVLAGDEYRFRVYERATNILGDLSLITYEHYFAGPQSPPIWSSPTLILGNQWDFTLFKSELPGRIFFWSIRRG